MFVRFSVNDDNQAGSGFLAEYQAVSTKAALVSGKLHQHNYICL